MSGVEYNNDLFSDDSDLSPVTNLLMLQLINPETHAFIDVPQMTYPVKYAVPLTSVGHQQYHYEVNTITVYYYCNVRSFCEFAVFYQSFSKTIIPANCDTVISLIYALPLINAEKLF